MSSQEALLELIKIYVSELEVKPTLEVCQCQWIDNFPVPGGRAVKMRGYSDPKCPVHTREGLILGYLMWLAKEHRLMLAKEVSSDNHKLQ